MMQKEALGGAMTRLTSQRIAMVGPEETKTIRSLLLQDPLPSSPPLLPQLLPMSCRTNDMWNATELDIPTLTYRARNAIRVGCGRCVRDSVEHHKPMQADHSKVEALGRFTNSMATANTSERLQQDMACTGRGCEIGHKRSTATPGGSDFGGTRRRKPAATVGPAQFAIALPAGIEMMGHSLQTF